MNKVELMAISKQQAVHPERGVRPSVSIIKVWPSGADLTPKDTFKHRLEQVCSYCTEIDSYCSLLCSRLYQQHDRQCYNPETTYANQKPWMNKVAVSCQKCTVQAYSTSREYLGHQKGQVLLQTEARGALFQL